MSHATAALPAVTKTFDDKIGEGIQDMTDRPILFSAPMVQALLAGRKTQTRRLLAMPKAAPTQQWVQARQREDDGTWQLKVPTYNLWQTVRVPFAVGDALWVRESFKMIKDLDLLPAGGSGSIRYEADGTIVGAKALPWGRLRPGIHMPRWASRLTLTVTNVRLERLLKITETDAEAEGMPEPYLGDQDHPFEGDSTVVSRSMQFRNLWNIINGKKAPWDSNPWVIAISFSVTKANIDSPKAT